MSETILVVDDHPDSIHIIRTILKTRNYTVITAESGPVALKLVASEPRPDLILLDVMMPGTSGLEVLQEIKGTQTTATIPVILVTAKTQDEDVLSGYQYGADYYITKPFTSKQLLYGIDLVLGKGAA